MFELTVPLEENFGDAPVKKSGRYNDLCTQIYDNEGPLKAVHFPFEVGARGFVARSTRGMLKKLDIPTHLRSSIIKKVSSCSAKCSYNILRAHKSFDWDRKRHLVNLSQEESTDEVLQ